jgi:hypothetical protein
MSKKKNINPQSPGLSNKIAPVLVTKKRHEAAFDYANKNETYQGERTTNVGLYTTVKSKLDLILKVSDSKGSLQDLVNNICTSWIDQHRDELNKAIRKLYV